MSSSWVGVFVATVTLTVLVGAQQNLLSLECPFPEGPDVNSDVECQRYSACQWTAPRCHMRKNAEAGYRQVGDPTATPTGFKVNLQKIDPFVSMFDNDVPLLTFEVIKHEDYHVQIKITDATQARYEVPTPLNLPSVSGVSPLYNVTLGGAGTPFHFSITRTSTGTDLFRSVGPLTYEQQFIQIHTWLASTYLYGFGENTHTSFRHKFSPRLTWPIFARDQPVGPGEMNEYGHHPYYQVIEDVIGNTHGVLLHSSNAMEYSTFLMDDGSPTLTLRTIGGIIDIHVFLGPTPEEVNTQYLQMVGTPALPPYWSLGFQLSKYGYTGTAEVRALRARTKAMGIPQDVQTLDIDYMLRYRDFTFDPVAWSDLPDLITELHNDDVKLTLILDPALVVDWDNYAPSQRGKTVDAFIKWPANMVPADQCTGCQDYMVGYVWPDTKTVFPDFLNPATRDWWGQELQTLRQTLQYDAIWIDMNEPANFGTNNNRPFNYPIDLPDWSLKCPFNRWDSPPYPTKHIRVGDNQSKRLSDHSICMSGTQTDGTTQYDHYNVHSLYGWSETVATFTGLQNVFPGKRPVVLSRSTYPGSGQYAVHWLGDNTADWTQIHMSIVGMLEFNLFGIPMVGADICGFFGEPSLEMCARWMQLGAFYPFSRNHNAIGNADQDPANWPEVAQISREALLLRYQYLPYLHTLFHEAHVSGNTVVRALWNVFPSDILARDVDDQFLWGSGLMVAPVITQGAVTRKVYFPQGVWYDLVSGVPVVTGPATLTVNAPLQVLPIYVKGGSILPWQVPATTTTSSRQNPFGLTIALDETESASGALSWDDGDSEYSLSKTYVASFTFTAKTLTMTVSGATTSVTGLLLKTLNLYGYSVAPSGVTVNGTPLVPSSWTYDAISRVLTLNLSVPLADNLSVVLQ